MAADSKANKVRILKNKRIVFERVEKFISPIYFQDVNLFSRLYPEKSSDADFLGHFSAGRERFKQIDEITKEKFSTVKVGESFGPTWSTHWFKVVFKIPVSWKGEQVRLRWNSNSEAMVWKDGKPVQGLTGGDGQVRTDFILTVNAVGGERAELYIEMAANGMFGAGKDGMINTPDPNRNFILSMVEIAVFNQKAYEIIRDLKILLDMVKHLPDDNQRAWQALYVGNDVVNSFQPYTNDSYERASLILGRFFKQSNGESQHVVHAVGHCHIDSAWLWPYDETIRKCARSWSSVIGLMKRYPKFKFVCSQAQQYQWVKDHYPSLYKEIKKFVASGQFIPVGGAWVEMDGNLPSGESFVRQFLYGQKFFADEFGTKSKVFWLPDTFGYSAQLPQIIKQCGMEYFVTQKISWNLINKFPHNTFLWQGIDGTRCITHFPPADTYESNAGADDVLKSSSQNKEKGLVNDSLLLYGFGDGGGGPTEDMLECISRMRDVDGIPRVQFSQPDVLFENLELCSEQINVWAGELYLELHQGTFTIHALVKKMNRMCEIRLHETEFLLVMSWLLGKEPDALDAFNYPSKELCSSWQLLMLNQFHDVLPGTSIKEVYDVALKYYQDILSSTDTIIEHATGFLRTYRESLLPGKKANCVLNSCSWDRKEVAHISSDASIKKGDKNLVQWLQDNSCFAMLEAPSLAMVSIYPKAVQPENVASLQIDGDLVLLQNGILVSTFTKSGHLISLKLKKENREVFASSLHGNQFALFDDLPLFWDAWDVMPYYKEARRTLNSLEGFSVLHMGPLRVSFEVITNINEASRIIQTISLDAESPFIRFATKVENWNENRKFLRVEFPVDVLADFASYEIQFGHVKRPTHGNTSWDWAKYEVCGHKWVDFSEHDFGVALFSDCKYGYSVSNKTMSISLLRSPKAPDNTADMGTHEFEYAIMPHGGSFQSAGVIQQAYNFNYKLREIKNVFPIKWSYPLQISSPAVILETLKKAEKVENAVVARLYEAYGGKTSAVLNCGRVSSYLKQITRCNLLEEPENDVTLIEGDDEISFKLEFKPFEIVTLIIEFKWD